MLFLKVKIFHYLIIKKITYLGNKYEKYHFSATTSNHSSKSIAEDDAAALAAKVLSVVGKSF